jgi:hypothetical protein
MRENRRILGLFVLCSMVGWFGLMASPAGAHVPPDNNANFNPDEWNGDGQAALGAGHGPDPDPANTKEGEVPSDAEDGFGTTYELRAVADSQTAFYEWYDCTEDSNPSLTGAACAPIATDTTPDAAPAPPGEGTAASFTGSYNIPSTSDGGPRDWYGIACNSDANTGGPPFDTSHCIANDVVPPNFEGDCGLVTPIPQTCLANLHPDDAQTTSDHTATTAGRIANFVTASRNFTQVEAHGAGLKNGDSLTVIAFTSAGGVDAVQVCMDQFSDDETPNDLAPAGEGGAGTCTHTGTDTSPTPGGGTGCDAAAPTAAGGDCWSVTIGVPNANTVFGVSLIEIRDTNDAEGATFGTGDCSGAVLAAADTGDDCQLDKVYVTTTAAGEAGAPAPAPAPTPAPPGPAPGTPGNPITGAALLCDRSRPSSPQSEIVIGDHRKNRICGFEGNDTLRGLGNNDTLVGGANNDTLAGGPGRDLGKGGGGVDRCRGVENTNSC